MRPRGHGNNSELEFRFIHRLHCGNEHRQVFRLTAGHHCVDSQGLYGRETHPRLKHRDDVVGASFRSLQHRVDFFLRRRNQREAIAPSLLQVMRVKRLPRLQLVGAGKLLQLDLRPCFFRPGKSLRPGFSLKQTVQHLRYHCVRRLLYRLIRDIAAGVDIQHRHAEVRHAEHLGGYFGVFDKGSGNHRHRGHTSLLDFNHVMDKP